MKTLAAATVFLLGVGTVITAPVPKAKPISNADTALERYIAGTAESGGNKAVLRRRSLASGLLDLQARLSKAGKTVEADAVRERLIVLDNIDNDRPWSGSRPVEILKIAATQGKYAYLLHVVYAPGDRTPYNDFNDFGHWPGTSYLNSLTLANGYWVYVHPRWYVWRDCKFTNNDRP